MKNIVYSMAVLLFLGGTNTGDAPGSPALKRVDKFRVMRHIDGWRPLDRRTLIVWASPSKPYLVELSRDSFGLRYASTIGVTSTAGNVYERFDCVVVDGVRYPIGAISELDPETARQMKKT
jgi:hypothetical protein